MGRLEGRTALVTGGGSGRAACLAFVFLVSDEAEYMIGQTLSPNRGDVSW